MKEICLFLSFIVIVVSLCIAYKELSESPVYAVCRQAGYNIQVNNEIMKLACSHHTISDIDIRWDTTNEDFIFYRDGKRCYVFNYTFRKYLDEIGYVDSLE